MKNIKILTILIVLICQLANSQDNYYFYSNNGLKVPLFKDNNHKILFTTANNINGTLLSKGIYKIKKENLNTNDLSSNTRPLYILNDGNQYFYKDEIVLKFKSYLTRVEIDSLIRKNNLELIKESLSFMLFKIDGDALEKANEIYESGNVLFCTPNFYGDALLFSNEPNDQYFHEQWYLHNIGQGTNDGNTTTFDADIDALEAWDITQGENINVAVLDTGIDKNHNDLANNIASISFNAQTGTSPSVINYGQSHGTHVAGTIAAVKDNNLQITGVAPKSKIIPISHSLSTSLYISAELASGISWAYLNGADIINNSWGDQGGGLYFELHSSLLESSIIDAMTLGRNGKGTIIVFASGNFGLDTPIIDYPANFDNRIITVGAINSIGQRAIFSPYRASGYGKELDVVAPGKNILSTVNNNHVNYSDGTSMAAPHVSGVVALILSVNPDLNATQVSYIIEQTTKKVGNYNYSEHVGRPNGTWNNEMGYGLVNAYAAVLKAQELLGADLYVKDNNLDAGAEPNHSIEEFWESVDIWVRNANDAGLSHQNPVYKANGQPNFIKIRVRNRGGQTSTGYEKWAV